MTFPEVMDALKQGKVVSRRSNSRPISVQRVRRIDVPEVARNEGVERLVTPSGMCDFVVPVELGWDDLSATDWEIG